ncbi:MAG: type II toxin-antitoxin system RelB/DinJ family antitoxin, partial [Bacillota bacterium]
MAKLSNVYTRIDPDIKEQAEAVLNGLGLSMATAMECFLRQVAYQRKIPFEMAMPSNPPTSLHDLSEAQFNALMD